MLSPPFILFSKHLSVSPVNVTSMFGDISCSCCSSTAPLFILFSFWEDNEVGKKLLKSQLLSSFVYSLCCVSVHNILVFWLFVIFLWWVLTLSRAFSFWNKAFFSSTFFSFPFNFKNVDFEYYGRIQCQNGYVESNAQCLRLNRELLGFSD